MDAVITDGIYGRELLELVRTLPIGSNPRFDRYCAMASIDFGDWDSVERCLAATPNDPGEIRGMRDLVLAPVGSAQLPSWSGRHQRLLFQIYDLQFSQTVRGYKRWAREITGFRPTDLWARGDIPMGRHARYRQLHDVCSLAIGEALGGRLPVALELAQEAQCLGDPGEPLRIVASDLAGLAATLIEASPLSGLRLPSLIAQSTGCSPLASWQWTNYLTPLILAAEHPAFDWAVELMHQAAVGLASPRAYLQARSWRAAQRISAGTDPARELTALVADARKASSGLRVLPALLTAIDSRQPNAFAIAERLARSVGNVWAQVAALVWSCALSPEPRSGRKLLRLLRASGWRRPVLTPQWVIQTAVSKIQDADTRRGVREALEPTGTAGRSLRSQAVRGKRTSRPSWAGAAPALSERELQVLSLAAEGLKNREIAERLSLSVHTVARHLANARGKLGAANRTEAAMRIVRRSP